MIVLSEKNLIVFYICTPDLTDDTDYIKNFNFLMNKQALPFNTLLRTKFFLIFFLGSGILFFSGKLVPSHRDTLAYGCLFLGDHPHHIMFPSL